jgi:hypothetical protein
MKPQKLSEPTVKISGPKASITIVERVNQATGKPVLRIGPAKPTFVERIKKLFS